MKKVVKQPVEADKQAKKVIMKKKGSKEAPIDKKSVKETAVKETKSKVTKVIKGAKKEETSSPLDIEISPREIKYKYPEDCKDTLTKKKFRASIRGKEQSFQKALSKLEEGTPEWKAKNKEYKAFRTEYYQ